MTLNSKYQKQKEVLSNSEKPPAANLIASYDVPTVLVKEKKNMNGKFIKQCAMKMAQLFGEENIARKSENIISSNCCKTSMNTFL